MDTPQLGLFSLLLGIASALGSFGGGGHGGYHDNSPYGNGGAGFERQSGGDVVAPYSNEDRQLAVNLLALRVGSGVGTGLFYGVPGTGHDFTNAHTSNGHHGNGGGYGKKQYGYETKHYGSSYGYKPKSYGGYNDDHDNKYYSYKKYEYKKYDKHNGYQQQQRNHGYGHNSYKPQSSYGHKSSVKYYRPIFTKAHLFY